jgi:copper oxidase (laccase) domain-containing protein
MSRPAPWIQKILDQEGGEKSWGYVIYCQALDDSPEWQQFRRRFAEIIDVVPVSGVGTEQIHHTKVADFVRFEGPEGDFDRVRE